MADFSIFDPSAAVQSMLTPPNSDQLRQRWDQYLNDPKTQAALLSFGGQAAQPMQWGQSNFGHLMSSVGQGGESVRKTEELDRKQQEVDSKSTLRESQATLAESRAMNAGLASRNAEDRLGMRRMELDQRDRLQLLGRQMQANRLYNEYVRTTQRANENEQLLRGRNARTTPIQSFEEWVNANPIMRQNLGLTPDQLQTPAPGGSGSPSSAAPPAPGGGPAPPSTAPSPAAPPPRPASPPPSGLPPAASRPHGYIYNDPVRGRVRWDSSIQRWYPAE